MRARLIAVLAAATLAATPTLAAEAPASVTGGTESTVHTHSVVVPDPNKATITVTYNETKAIADALEKLDPPNLDFPATFLVAKFKAMAALRADLEVFNEVRMKIVRKHAGKDGRFAPPECADPKNQATCRLSEEEAIAMNEISELSFVKHDVAITRLPLAGFQLDKNKIAGSTMAVLVPLIDE